MDENGFSPLKLFQFLSIVTSQLQIQYHTFFIIYISYHLMFNGLDVTIKKRDIVLKLNDHYKLIFALTVTFIEILFVF